MLSSETQEFLWNFRNGIWSLGIISWLFGISDRTLAALTDGYLSATDIIQLLTAAFFFAGWLCLKPTDVQTRASVVEE